jgi:hydrogenase maturation protease
MLFDLVLPSRHRFVEPWTSPESANGEHSRARRSLPLVLGFGNLLLRDDGAGVRLMSQLRAGPGAAIAQYIDAGTMSFSLLPYIEAAGALLVIDAADVSGTPGAVRLFEGILMDAFLQGGRRRTVHEVGITDLLDMARLRGCLPQRRALLCVQPGCIDWGEALSPAVAGALPAAAQVAHALLQGWAAP